MKVCRALKEWAFILVDSVSTRRKIDPVLGRRRIHGGCLDYWAPEVKFEKTVSLPWRHMVTQIICDIGCLTRQPILSIGSAHLSLQHTPELSVRRKS